VQRRPTSLQFSSTKKTEANFHLWKGSRGPHFLHEICPNINIQEDYTKHLSVVLTGHHQHTVIVFPITGWYLERVSHDTCSYMTSHEGHSN
jgi:hypothetical protein